MFRWTALIACLLAASIGLAIGVMNPDTVLVALPGWSLELPLGSLLMLAFAVGVGCGLAVYMFLFHLPAWLNHRRARQVAKGDSLPRNA